MPIFDYECSCGNRFEKLVMNTTKKLIVVCPECGAKKPKKVMSNISLLKISGYKESNGYSKKAQTDEEIIKAGPEKSIANMRDAF